ncbi:hypothetical protein GCM10025880_16710 [Methylorubrum aminovorans]|nr:hypothetical protein GCM10025880_16710 [Methylorubrum aminovorans]
MSGSGEGDVLLGAGLDRGHRGARVGGDATGHHRRADALVGERLNHPADVEADIDHDEVTALGAQGREPLVDPVRVGDRGPRFMAIFEAVTSSPESRPTMSSRMAWYLRQFFRFRWPARPAMIPHRRPPRDGGAAAIRRTCRSRPQAGIGTPKDQ